MSQRTRAKAMKASATRGSRQRLWQIAGGAALTIIAAVGILAFRVQREVPAATPGQHGAAVPAPPGGGTGVGSPAMRVLRGGIHTVHHSTEPLPTASDPRPDGRPTLVWFSGTWCVVCATMQPFADHTIAQFASRMASVEKSVDHDRPAASRFAVRGTPTFVLINAEGAEIQRFYYQPTGERLRQAIDAALQKSGL